MSEGATGKTTKEYADRLVSSIVGDKFVEQWWNSPNRAFNFLTPLEVWKTDRIFVLRYLYNHIFGGEFS